MQSELQLNEFFVEGGNQQQSHVLLHITEPSTPEEQAKGYFFAICEINNAAQKYITKLQEIIDNAENAYYDTEPSGDKTALEVILEKMNQEAFALVDDEVELHCIIGAIAEPTITFTYHGHPQALLFYRNRQGQYQKMDLIAQNPADIDASKTQLFSDVIQGKISAHDFLFLSTPHLTNYFTHDRIQKVVTVRPANQSAQHFEHVLSELREGYSFGGLVVHQHVPPEPVALSPKTRPHPENIGSERSMNNLFTTERNTAATLSPTLFPRVPTTPERPRTSAIAESETVHRAPVVVNAPHSKPRIATPHHSQKSDKIITAIKYILPIFSAIGRGLLWGLLAIYSGVAGALRNFILLIFAATNYQNRRKLIVDEWRRHWRSRKQNFSQLPLITKVIALLVVLIAVGFVVGLSYMRMRAREQAALAAYQSLLSDIRTKRNAAESNLIYRNESAALTELTSAEGLLATLPCASKEEKTNCENLRTELGAIATRLRKQSTVSPELLTSMPIFGSSTVSLVKVDDRIIAVSGGSSAVMGYNIATKETKILTTVSQASGFITLAAPKENDYILLETTSHEFIKFDPKTDTVSSSVISFPHTTSNITSFVVYNRRLYTLDQTNSQIYRHVTIRDGYDIGKEWIKTPGTNLQNGVALTVDGDMYVLRSNGQIAKFASGDLQPGFSLQTIDPTLTSADKIWTYTDVNNIYILDSQGKRIIVVDKNGQLKQQITSDQFVRPSDFAIDEPGRTAYVIDSGRLYKVPLTF